jgi:DNA repair protein RecO (recombination protein O)
MEATYRTKAIVLDRSPHQECDSQVVVYSLLAGRQNLIARGTAKTNSKLAGHLEPFNIVELMVIKGRGADYAGAVTSLVSVNLLKQDLNKITSAGYVCGLVKQLIKTGEAESRIFNLLGQYLVWLNAVQAPPSYYSALSRLVVWKILVYLGLAPARYKWLGVSLSAQGAIDLFANNDFPQAVKQLQLKKYTASELENKLDHIIKTIIS